MPQELLQSGTDVRHTNAFAVVAEQDATTAEEPTFVPTPGLVLRDELSQRN